MQNQSSNLVPRKMGLGTRLLSPYPYPTSKTPRRSFPFHWQVNYFIPILLTFENCPQYISRSLQVQYKIWFLSRDRFSTPKLWVRNGKRLVRLENFNAQDSTSKTSKLSRCSSSCSFDKQATTSNSLLDLPNECLLMVMKNLSQQPHELCQLVKVCKRFYKLSFSPRLWGYANFRHLSFIANLFHKEVNNRKTSRLSYVERKKKFANFLISRKAILSDLRIHCNIYEEIKMVRSLIDNCCTSKLQYFELRWTFYKFGLLNDERTKANLKLFREVLQKVSAQSPFLFFVKTQLDGSCLTASIIRTMTNIQHLELIFEGPIPQEKGTNAIEILLSSLKRLKKFKIRVQQRLWYDQFPGYTLKSDSLQQFDYTWCKGFDIKFIDLPQLHTFLAFDTFCEMQGIITPCLFQLIEEGCPSLTTLNDMTSTVPGLKNFPVDEDYKIGGRFLCMCCK